MILFDMSPLPSDNPVAIAFAIGFFIVLAAIAFIAYRLLKRTLKMAVRMIVVGVIIVIAIIGSIALYFGLGSSNNNRPRPPRQTVNSTR